MLLTLIDAHKYKYGNKTITDNDLIEMIKNGTFEQFVALAGNEVYLKSNYYGSDAQSLQQIFIGPPGTGKSYKITSIVQKYYPNYNPQIGNNSNVFRTAIHSEFCYSDFVGSILPTLENDGKNISYSFIPGIFTLALTEAFKKPNQNIFLIIEEMSRGNIASIFGDLFQLFDRAENGISEYSIFNSQINNYIIEKINDNDIKETLSNNIIYLPKNFNILGSINSSDQNVFVTDTAFKRRFDLKYIDTSPIATLNDYKINIYNINSSWLKFYPILNKFILTELNLEEDKQIGQFFIKFKYINNYNLEKDLQKDLEKYIFDWNESQLKEKLMIYLWNDIQLASSFSEKKLFSDKIYSLNKLLTNIKNNELVFSDDFIDFYQNETNNEN
ncbi:MAG: AAA family ATPase [Pleomorphochaeta sp.]